MNLHIQASENVHFSAEKRMNKTVYCILGHNTFNNEMLSEFFESETGFECHTVAPYDLDKFQQENADKKYVIFFDCATISKMDAFEKALSIDAVKNEADKMVCINVDPQARLEKMALEHGIRGMVYDHLPITTYHRAAQAVLNGELWYAREVLERHFLTEEATPYDQDEANTPLTRREKEILKLLAMGMQNQEIAGKLFISPHTVKTHAYNLYKKIHVSSRFEAVQWLEKYHNH